MPKKNEFPKTLILTDPPKLDPPPVARPPVSSIAKPLVINCGTCVHYRGGHCKYNPPIYNLQASNCRVYPPVQVTDRCGRWETEKMFEWRLRAAGATADDNKTGI